MARIHRGREAVGYDDDDDDILFKLCKLLNYSFVIACLIGGLKARLARLLRDRSLKSVISLSEVVEVESEDSLFG